MSSCGKQSTKSSKVVSAEEAARLVSDGDTVSVCGVIGFLCPDRVLQALGDRYAAEGSPRDLTLVTPVAVGDVYDIPGADHLARPGLLKRVISGSYVIGTSPKTGRRAQLVEMILAGEVEAYNFPIGALMALHREIGAGRPGLLTEVGLGSFVDPRIAGGRLNEATRDDLVQVVTLADREYLFYRSFPVDVAIIRGTTADERGNITLEHEGMSSGVFCLALAAHNSGGKVIAQVKRVAAAGSLHPQMVRVPGILVDAIVVDEHQKQGTGIEFDPTVCGEVKGPPDRLEPLALGPEKVICRRALGELRQGDLVILGFGVPAGIPSVAAEEGQLERLTFTIEHGAIGGIPLPGFQFGVSANPEAIIDTTSQFDLIDGGAIDAACLAFAEVDPWGSVNVSKLPNLIPGCGGFINITEKVRKLVFCGLFSAGGLEVAVEEGELRIKREGKFCKFVESVQHLTLDGRRIVGQGRRAVFITERAVFELGEEGLVLSEVAPGVDPERDVMARMQFRVGLSERISRMDARLFRPDRVGISLPPR